MPREHGTRVLDPDIALDRADSDVAQESARADHESGGDAVIQCKRA